MSEPADPPDGHDAWPQVGPALDPSGALVGPAPRASPTAVPQVRAQVPIGEVETLELHDRPLVEKPPPDAPGPLLDPPPPERRRSRGALRAVGLLALLAAAGLGAAYLWQPKRVTRAWERVRGAPDPSAVVVIDSSPDRAQVFRGDALLGDTPLAFSNPEPLGRPFTLLVKRAGYLPRLVKLVGGKSAHVELELVRKR